MAVTNHQFAAEVGCNYTMASRLRSGQRLPSATMLNKICDAYGLDKGKALDVHQKGKEEFSAWLREQVFDKSAEDTPEENSAA